MFQKCNYNSLIVLLVFFYSLSFSQIDLQSRELQSILKKANISKTEAERMIQKESILDLDIDPDSSDFKSMGTKLKLENQLKEIELKNDVLNERLLKKPINNRDD